MLRSLRFVMAAAFLAACALATASRAGDDKGFKPLFNGKNLDGWKIFLKDDKADPAKAISVNDGEIQVSGADGTFGYFHTTKSFKNYVLTFDWRYQRPEKLEDDKKFGGNSGLLMHIQEPHKVWPTSLEVQGANGRHGSFIGIDRKSTRLNSSHGKLSRMPSSA